MVRRLLAGCLVIFLAGCGMLPGGAAPATPIPTFTPAAAVPPAVPPVANATQAAALGGKQSGELFVWVYSSPNPPIRGSNTFEAVIADAAGQAVSDAKISFDVDMTNMSHGKNVVTAAAKGEGRYTGNISFMMPGPWRLIVAVERGGKTSQVRFDFNVNSR